MIKKIWILSLLFALTWMVTPLMALPNSININSANAETLAKQLKGIGLTKAAAMVAYRKINGPFIAIEDMVLVKGIGWKTMEANRAVIRLRDKKAGLAAKTGNDKTGSKSALSSTSAMTTPMDR